MKPAPYTSAYYDVLLETALRHGWSFVPFDRIGDADESRGERSCLLRHDCDNDLVAACKMSEAEARHGVKSTYFIMLRSALYNPLSLPGKRLIGEILSNGHWLGLHFDELPFADESPVAVAERVRNETEWLQDEFGVPVGAVSFHQPSGRILGNEIPVDVINTYDLRLFREIRYVSDSNLRFSEENDPLAVFADPGERILQLLIHPEWWTAEYMDASAKWRHMFRNNFRLMEADVADREDAYLTRHDVEFIPHKDRD